LPWKKSSHIRYLNAILLNLIQGFDESRALKISKSEKAHKKISGTDIAALISNLIYENNGSFEM